MEDAVLISPNAWAEFGPAMEIFEEAIGAIIEGNTTPEEAMDQAQQRAEAMNP
jgi:ABC-type glycerol-3-phosphate transport system substrate-binding protein